jgi:hypothetical protein
VDDEPAWVHNEAGERANAYMVVGDTKLAPLLVALAAVGLALAGLSFGLACWALDRADQAERQAVIAKMRTEGFTRALIAKGIDPYPHIEGEPP